MRTITRNVYTYKELTAQAKKKAIEYFMEHGPAADFWWTDIYEDAKETANLIIDGFDLNHGRSINVRPLEFQDAESSAKKVLKQHGESCETYQIAKTFLEEYDAIDMEYEGDEERVEELCDDYFEKIGNAYLRMLEREYDDITSEDYAIDYMENNNYEFYADGTRYIFS